MGNQYLGLPINQTHLPFNLCILLIHMVLRTIDNTSTVTLLSQELINSSCLYGKSSFVLIQNNRGSLSAASKPSDKPTLYHNSALSDSKQYGSTTYSCSISFLVMVRWFWKICPKFRFCVADVLVIKTAILRTI